MHLRSARSVEHTSKHLRLKSKSNGWFGNKNTEVVVLCTHELCHSTMTRMNCCTRSSCTRKSHRTLTAHANSAFIQPSAAHYTHNVTICSKWRRMYYCWLSDWLNWFLYVVVAGAYHKCHTLTHDRVKHIYQHQHCHLICGIDQYNSSRAIDRFAVRFFLCCVYFVFLFFRSFVCRARKTVCVSLVAIYHTLALVIDLLLLCTPVPWIKAVIRFFYSLVLDSLFILNNLKRLPFFSLCLLLVVFINGYCISNDMDIILLAAVIAFPWVAVCFLFVFRVLFAFVLSCALQVHC